MTPKYSQILDIVLMIEQVQMLMRPVQCNRKSVIQTPLHRRFLHLFKVQPVMQEQITINNFHTFSTLSTVSIMVRERCWVLAFSLDMKQHVNHTKRYNTRKTSSAYQICHK